MILLLNVWTDSSNTFSNAASVNSCDVLGMTAPQAAGVIHSDFEKGFIRAETVSSGFFLRASFP